MSRDLLVLLPQPEFPIQNWEEITDRFGAKEIPPRISRSRKPEKRWAMSDGASTLHIDLWRLSDSHVHSKSYNWKIGFHFQAKYSPMQVWAAFSMPYHLLSAIGECGVFYDPGTSSELLSLECIESYGHEYLLSLFSPQELAKAKILDSSERVSLASLPP